MNDLTQRQQQILQFLVERIARQGEVPSLNEIAQAFDIHLNAARKHLQALESKGVIERVPGQARGIRLPDREPTLRAMTLPLVGRVAAGTPILAQANIETSYQIDPGLFRPQAHFLLRVEGQSMIDAGIAHGDLIAVHRTPVAEPGRIVVARVDDAITVKRLMREGEDGWLLQAANPEFAPIRVDPNRHEFAIEGLFVGVIRRH